MGPKSRLWNSKSCLGGLRVANFDLGTSILILGSRRGRKFQPGDSKIDLGDPRGPWTQGIHVSRALGPGPWSWALVPCPGPWALVPGPGPWALVPGPRPWSLGPWGPRGLVLGSETINLESETTIPEQNSVPERSGRVPGSKSGTK